MSDNDNFASALCALLDKFGFVIAGGNTKWNSEIDDLLRDGSYSREATFGFVHPDGRSLQIQFKVPVRFTDAS